MPGQGEELRQALPPNKVSETGKGASMLQRRTERNCGRANPKLFAARRCACSSLACVCLHRMNVEKADLCRFFHRRQVPSSLSCGTLLSVTDEGLLNLEPNDRLRLQSEARQEALQIRPMGSGRRDCEKEAKTPTALKTGARVREGARLGIDHVLIIVKSHNLFARGSRPLSFTAHGLPCLSCQGINLAEQ